MERMLEHRLKTCIVKHNDRVQFITKIDALPLSLSMILEDPILQCTTS
jgi:hypothetical protein